MKTNSLISVVIPFFNEEKTIKFCLSSLEKQTYHPFEIILVNDGSRDKSKDTIGQFLNDIKTSTKVIFLQSPHRGTAKARNLGVSEASGDILVFVDSDMTFDPNFLKVLTEPIIEGESYGTFTKEEYVSNWDNPWARVWNYNEGISSNRRVPENYPDTSPVFRAVLAKEYKKAGGFDDIGFTDDWTLSRKLGYKAIATKAVCYHKNPQNLNEIYTQARWIGKNEFITGSSSRILFNLIRFNPIVQLVRGMILAARYHHIYQIPFSCVYSIAFMRSIVGVILGESKYK